MKERKAEWKFEETMVAYRDLMRGELDHDEYRVRLSEIEMAFPEETLK